MTIRDWYYRHAMERNGPRRSASASQSIPSSHLALPLPYYHPSPTVPTQAIVPSGASPQDYSGIPVSQADVLTVGGAMRFHHPSSSGLPVVSSTAKSLPSGVSPARGPRVRFHDPLSLIYATGFRDRRFSLTYDTLRRMTYQLSLLNAIILTRVNQVASFSKPYRKNRQLGFEIKFKDVRYIPDESERIAIERLEQFMVDCGWGPNPYAAEPRDDFETFLKKFVRDTLTYDQACAEIVPDEDGRPFEFMAVDASTIRLAATYDGYRGPEPKKLKVGRDFSERWSREYGEDFEFDGETVFSVQVMHGRIENIFTHNDLAFCIRNPRSDVWVAGYGFAEGEMCLSSILRTLWAEEYNSRVFRQGSMANGILNFKGDNFDPSQLEAFRRIWQANVAGVENCLHEDTKIWIQNEGQKSIRHALGDEDERHLTLWTGTSWEKGRIFRTSLPKRLCVTTVEGDIKIKTSPDHKFRVIGHDGEPEWRCQKDLLIGDLILCNKRKVFSDDAEVVNDCKIHPIVIRKYVNRILDTNTYDKCFDEQARVNFDIVISSAEDFYLSDFVGFLRRVEMSIPSWLGDYYFKPVTALERTEEFVQMYDVEMFTEEHQFVADGIITHNSHRMPIVQIPEGVEFVSLQRGNKEMEYRAWLDYLLKIVSGTFQIDPAEINFDLVGGGGARSAPLFESKHEWKLKHSRDKGLRPLLEFVAKSINKYIIDPLDSRLYFDFIGLDRITESDRIELNSRKVSSYMTLNEVRQEEGLNPVAGGDIILNPIYLQSVQLPPGVLGGSRVGANPLSPWLTEGEGSPPGYGDAVAVPLYMQEGGDEEMATFQLPETQPGMPPGAPGPQGEPSTPPGVPSGAQPGPGMTPEGFPPGSSGVI